CNDLDSVNFLDKLLLGNLVEEIVVLAMHGLSLFQAGNIDNKGAKLQCESSPKISKKSAESSAKSEAKNDGVAEAKAIEDAVEIVKANASKKGDTDVVAKADLGKK
ncbi:hypothetical protein L7F22_035892, partial [Adiantum nelumboides]|nr:hypothetical protein [Adiantum nelumboides]